MDVREYISSGVIELYAMNALPAHEMQEVESMAAAHPEIAAELRQVQNALGDYASAYTQNPRPSLRAEILQSIENSYDAKGKVVQMPSRSMRTVRLLAAACISIVLISGFTIFSLYQKWQDAENRYVSILNEKNQMASNFTSLKNSYETSTTDLAILRNENTKVITLQATDSTKHYLARVYWNNQTHDAFIDVRSLPAPASDKQFQLWALVSGKPVDAGVFNVDSAGIQKVKTILSADRLAAVTLEPKGGSAFSYPFSDVPAFKKLKITF